MTIPPILLTMLLAASSPTTTKAAAPKGSAAGNLVFLGVLGLCGYMLYRSMGRNRKLQAQRQGNVLSTLGPGDEVLTGAGIFGTVLDVADDRVTIETAPGTRITVLRSTIARRIEPDTVDDLGDVDDQNERDRADEADGEGDGGPTGEGDKP